MCFAAVVLNLVTLVNHTIYVCTTIASSDVATIASETFKTAASNRNNHANSYHYFYTPRVINTGIIISRWGLEGCGRLGMADLTIMFTSLAA